MISIIICSRTTDIPKALKENISQTVGCENELVVIDNSTNSYSIFQAYNEGIRLSHGDILCFMHDDVLHHTEGWGRIITEQFVDDSIGVIGVAGTHFIPKAPMYWWVSPYISQFNLGTDNSVQKFNDTSCFFENDLADVVAVDGLCFFAPRSLFRSIRFDEENYSGFHAYDMDLCLQVQNFGKRVCVTRSILVEHLWSESSFLDKRYMHLLDKNMNIFFQKWKDQLPMSRGVEQPQIVWDRLNNLCIMAYDAKVARSSKAYRLGRVILSPIKWLKSRFYCFRNR